MEMIDVLKKLEEIAQTRPELVADAVDNVSRTNPVQVQDNVGRNVRRTHRCTRSCRRICRRRWQLENAKTRCVKSNGG